MSEEIRVHVVQERDRTNLTMRYRDPITGKQVKRSAETANRKKAMKKARVVVNREMKKVKEKILDPKTKEPTGRTRLVEREVVKFASCHDLRRSFGTRWARRVMPATLKLLMRHSSIDTTMRYYVRRGGRPMGPASGSIGAARSGLRYQFGYHRRF